MTTAPTTGGHVMIASKYDRSRVAIISTSIGRAPTAYAEWATAGDLIIAGDLNSPLGLSDYIRELGGTYLTPTDQRGLPWLKHIGWSCVQRRVAALAHAMRHDYDFIITVDDDNTPTPNASSFVASHLTELDRFDGHTVVSNTRFLNTGVFCVPAFHARGAPYGLDTDTAEIQCTRAPIDVVVSQAQVIGDPDCDAVERMCHRPVVTAVRVDVVVAPGTYAAFNSQATVWTRRWAPVSAVLPGIGRYDDIFAAFLFHRLGRTYGAALHVGTPVVVQRRNEHDPIFDLKQELWGMYHTLSFCDALDRAHISANMPLHIAYDELTCAVEDVLPARTVAFMREWTKFWRTCE